MGNRFILLCFYLVSFYFAVTFHLPAPAGLMIYSLYATKSVLVESACIYQYVSAVSYGKVGGLNQPVLVWS